MKLISLLLLSVVLVSCGQKSKSSTKTMSMDSENDALSSTGVAVKLGYLTGSVLEKIIVVCSDSQATKANVTNTDRIHALQHYKDTIDKMQFAEFTDGTRIDVWKIDWAINAAINTLDDDAYGSTCPASVLGSGSI